MSIETICRHCARKLRVDDEFAGRKARCPHCKNVYTVPQALGPQTVREAEVLPTQPFAVGQGWRLRTEDGSVYGPVSKSEVDSWVTEGRITAECDLQRDGSSDWVKASSVYPALNKSAAQPASSNPFAEGATPHANPYSPPTTLNPTNRARAYPPHRGGTILTFGIVGIACCIIFAPIAWIMGQSDLAQIRSGRMDPAGRSLTQAGMVLGIIGTLLLAVQAVFFLVGVFTG